MNWRESCSVIPISKNLDPKDLSWIRWLDLLCLALIMLIASLAGTQISFLIRSEVVEGRLAVHLKSTIRAETVLKSHLENYVYGLKALQGLYSVSGFHPEMKMQLAFARANDSFESYHGALGMGFIRLVHRTQLENYLHKTNEGRALPGIKDLSGGKNLDPDLFIVESIHPVSKNQAAWGLDMGSEKKRRDACLKAQSTGKPSMSAPVELVQLQGSDRGGFLIFNPVFLSTGQLAGWTYAPIASKVLLSKVEEVSSPDLFFEIHDKESAELVARSTWDPRQNLKGFEPEPLRASEINIFNRTWTVQFKTRTPLWTPSDSLRLGIGLVLFKIALTLIMIAILRTQRSRMMLDDRRYKLEGWQSAILKSDNLMVISIQINGRVESLNQAATRILGYQMTEPSESVKIHQILNEGELRPLVRHEGELDLIGSLRLVGSRFLRLHLKTSQGEFVPVQLSVSPVLGEFDEVLGFVLVAQDMTALDRAENQVRQLVKALYDSAIVAQTDASGRIVDVNANFCEISGYSREELIGKDHRLVNSGAHPKEFFRDLWNTIRSGRVWTGEIQNRRKNGEAYWVHSVITPMLNELGIIDRFLAIRFDVTEKKQAEIKLLQSSKMASLGEMAGGVAHEINNPLAVIKGRVDIVLKNLKKENPDLAKAQVDLEKINLMTARISKIVLGLRTFSRDSSQVSKERVELFSIFEETADLCRENFKMKGIELFLPVSVSMQVECNSIQLSQVLLNLLNNAKDAISELSEKWIRVECESGPASVRVMVTDSGRGIPPEIVEKIMQPFFTTKEVGKGTGLGLSISKGLIESQGGKLYYDSSCARTRFVIELPLPAGQQAGLAA